MPETPIFIIAEAGVNHNGDMDLALKLIDAAAEAGADAVKFQTFKAKEIATEQAGKASYQKETSDAEESQLAMLQKLELKDDAYGDLVEHCKKKNIQFLSTPFDCQSLDMLLELGISTIKVPSGEITNKPYLRYAGSKGVPIILSTGMTTLSEVGNAIQVLVDAGTPRNHVTLLHCNTQYPTPMEDANLRAMNTLARSFPACPVGYSDHTPGISCAVAAATMGATVIEKHFTLDKTMEGPDHAASLDPAELAAMVSGVRDIEKAMGDGTKQPSPSEMDNINVARRFLVASTSISKGESYSESNVVAKRTGKGGISPMRWDEVMGTSADRNYEIGEIIQL